MKFVHPHILYLLGFLVIPIIIHLFNLRRYKKFYFPSLLFIKKIEKETSSTKKLRYYLILASRLMAFTALILAFAQPYFPTVEKNGSVNSVIPIYLDNSYSMSAKGANGDLLNQAKAVVQDIVDSYPREQKYVLVTNALDGPEYRIISKSEVEDQMEAIQLSPLSRNILSPIESINSYLDANQQSGHENYYILSDFQKNIFPQTSSTLDSNANFSLIKMVPQLSTNLYIDSVWFEQPFQRVGQNNTLNVRVQNTGNKELTNVELNLQINDLKRQTLVDLSPNNYTIATFNYVEKTEGFKSGKVEVMDENLYFDNRFYFTYSVSPEVSILVINDNSSTNYPELVYKTDDYYNVKSSNVNQLISNDLNTANLIVLNEIRQISSGLQTQLQQLIENGTHLLIIPSNNGDIHSYNNLLGSVDLPLIKGISESEIRIGKIFSNQDFFSGMFDSNVDNIRMPPLKRYFSTTTYTNANYNRLIQYENDLPLFVENSKYDGVYALYSSIHPEFNNFGKTAIFSSILLRVGEKSQGKNPLYLTIGESDAYRLKTANSKSAISLHGEDDEFIPEITENMGSTLISVSKSDNNYSIQDGIYKIVQEEDDFGVLALNYNRTESDMEYASIDEINSYFKSLGIKNIETSNVKDLNDIHRIVVKQPHEYWRILLILALAFFLLEMLIIIFWKR